MLGICLEKIKPFWSLLKYWSHMRIRWTIRQSPHKWFPDGSLPTWWQHMDSSHHIATETCHWFDEGPSGFKSQSSVMFLYWTFAGLLTGLQCILLPNIMLVWLRLDQMQTLERQFCRCSLSRVYVLPPSVTACESPEWNTHLQPFKEGGKIIYLYCTCCASRCGCRCIP